MSSEGEGVPLQALGERARTETLRPVRDTAGTMWAIVGYALLLILLYWLVAKRKVSGTLSNAWEAFAKAAKVWMSNSQDPLAHLERGLGHGAIAIVEQAGGGEAGGPTAPPPKQAAEEALRGAAHVAEHLTGGISQRQAERLGITPTRA